MRCGYGPGISDAPRRVETQAAKKVFPKEVEEGVSSGELPRGEAGVRPGLEVTGCLRPTAVRPRAKSTERWGGAFESRAGKAQTLRHTEF
jgi:hypothetical protein